MPIYEYVCQNCGNLIDVLQKISDPPPNRCEKCGTEGPLTKRVSRTSFVLKGGGWGSDLYASTKKESGSKDSSPKDTSTTTKPAAASTTSSTGTASAGATSTTPAPASSAGESGAKK